MKLARFLPAVAVIAAACADLPTAPERTPQLPSASVAGAPTGSVAVVFVDEASVSASTLGQIAALGGTLTSRHDDIGVVFVSGLSLGSVAQLLTDPAVASIGVDRWIDWLPGLQVLGAVEAPEASPSGHKDFTTVPWFNRQWNMRVIQADRAWGAGFSGAGAKVAILDTGLDYGNRELVGLVDLSKSASFVPSDPVLPTDHPVTDLHFHGTHVASSVVTNGRTIAGVAPHTTLIGVKVLSFRGSGSFEGVIGGIMHATNVDADVINMSLGAGVDLADPEVPPLVTALARAVRYAEKNGTIVISAAGNDELNLDDATAPYYVPCEVSTICVSATGPVLQQNFDQPSWYTNYGATAVEVAAPGGNSDPVNGNDHGWDLIYGACARQTTQPGLAPCRASTDGVAYFYALAAGTSMATPHVSGVAALIKAASPMLPVSALKNRIIEYSDDLGAAGLDPYYGYGRINAWRSLTRQ